MGKLIAFDRGRFLRYYIPRSKFQTVIEEAFFVLGVLGTIVVPQVIYCAIGGPISPSVFIVSAQAGVIVGLIKYMRPPAAVASVVDTRTAPITQDDKTRRRKTS